MTTGQANSGVQINSACHRTIIPTSEAPQSVYFMTEIAPTAGIERLPANIVLVVDRSGAVIEECLPGLKEALRDLIDQLRPDDSLALVSMSGQVIIPAERLQQPNLVKRQLDHLGAAAETHTRAGLEEGLRQCQVQAGPGPDRVGAHAAQRAHPAVTGRDRVVAAEGAGGRGEVESAIGVVVEATGVADHVDVAVAHAERVGALPQHGVDIAVAEADAVMIELFMIPDPVAPGADDFREGRFE